MAFKGLKEIFISKNTCTLTFDYFISRKAVFVNRNRFATKRKTKSMSVSLSVCLFEWLIGQTLTAIGYPALGKGARGGGG